MDNDIRIKDQLSTFLKYVQIALFTSVILYFGKPLFIPACFGLLVAVVAYPVCKWLESKHWPRSIAIAAVITVVVSLFFALTWLLSIEVYVFIHDMPLIVTKIKDNLPPFQHWLQQKFGLSVSLQNQWINNSYAKIQSEIVFTFRSVVGTTISTIFGLILIPIYAALLLFHRETFVRYLEMTIGKKYNGRLHSILGEITSTYFNFIKGTFFVYIIVGVLNSSGLYLLGIKNALLYGMLAAFMTIIPYVGIIISALLPITAALITKDSIWYPIGIILVFSFVQYLEANIIFPKVVGTQLNVSTLAIMMAIILGTILWGIAGMILFIPFVAILKIVSDHIEEWKPINILLSR